MFIMLDGIDGSGKSTILEVWKNYLTAQGNAVFDLKHYWQTQKKYPPYQELRSYDFIFSCEPTYAPVGELIRKELVRDGADYPLLAIAEAYSLDRLILYQQIIIPLLEEDKCVIQDRGVSSSLAYQTVSGEFTLEEIADLPGNKLALQHRPDFLVLARVKPETAMQRLAARTTKKDNVIFEKLEFQTKLAEIFESPNFQNMFLKRGAKIFNLPAEEKIDIMEKETVKLLTKLINF